MRGLSKTLLRFLFGSPFGTCRRGGVAVEGAFAMAFLMVTLGAVVDFGGYIRMGIEVKQALRSGGQLALDLGAIGQVDYNDNSAIQSAIEPVIRSAANVPDSGLTITSVSTSCVCPDGASGSQYCAGSGSYTSCTNNRPGERYLKVVAQSKYDPLFNVIPFFSPNLKVTEQLEMRVQ